MGRIAGLTSEEVRERLLAAAIEVFLERGYEGAATGEIARRAGLSVGAIYSNYGTKAELLGHAIAAHVPAELAELFATRSSDTAAVILSRLAAALPTRTPRHGAMLIESFAAARRDPEVAKMIAAGFRARKGKFQASVERAQRDGTARADLPADALAHLCMTVVLGSLIANGLELPRPDPAAWAQVTDHLIAAVRAPSQPGTPPANARKEGP